MALETENRQLDPSTVTAGVRAVFADDSRGRYLVATDGGEVVGSLLLTYEWSDWRNRWFWWIQSVYVAPAARRQGTFRSLFDAVVADARARHDVFGIRLYVASDNVLAQSVYTSLGLGAAGYGVYELDVG
ncbi:MAG: GNAT family N-acetyltransferase [Acidimicrobiia bacterium]|nr:GNAT family N-acetyltransferase [Acidimicrobiia bacterium]NNL28265.1 GNAT family N-acetyltransferase [Acidimicrobiia bacterium]